MAICQPSITLNRRALLLAMLVALALGTSGCSNDGSTTLTSADKDDVNLTAQAILSKMVAAYRHTDRYSDRAQYFLETVRRVEGVKREKHLFDFSLALQRPNRIRFHFQRMYPRSRRNVSFDLISDGKLVHSYAGQLPQQVHEIKAPEQLTPENFIPEPQMRETVLQVSLENIYPQLVMLLAGDNLVSVFPDDREPRLLEQQKLEGRDCHRVVLESSEGQRVLWIDAETYALRRMKLPLEAQISQLDPQKKYSQYKVWIDYLEPTLDAEFNTAQFTAELPAEVRRVSRFVFPPPPGPMEILGQPVADFSFTTLNGEEVTPATLAGNLVVMEFWSKTCPPCRQHTPLLDRVYRELKDSEDFLFFAVNANLADTSNNTVAQLFRDWGGSIPLLRDLEETSYTKLGIAAYPHTIIIGRDGRLQMYQPGMHVRPEPLVDAVRQLLDGADLAAEAHGEYAKVIEKYEQELAAATLNDPPPAEVPQDTVSETTTTPSIEE